MFKTIEWRMYISATSKVKAQIVIERLKQEIGQFKILALDQYWKDKSLFELIGKSSLQIEEPERAVFYILKLVNKLGGDINITGPITYENDRLEFEGVCSSPTIIGLSWFYFHIDNFE
ncbi:hypothetical protein KDJ21_018410 [Metabacillus litoralis]|uniref:hypothetical protein n=1 Tax=Metabacillus TaxID=2675233 RepID=UPI001B97D3E6|nr:hypothetical protein [Metabacillus litoralis]UHA58785.1 hypothetical protein KDJ21_018410 [Metabacillus litoralis]